MLEGSIPQFSFVVRVAVDPMSLVGRLREWASGPTWVFGNW
jgi:hypothetical protein